MKWQFRRNSFILLSAVGLLVMLSSVPPTPAADPDIPGPKAIYIIRHAEKPTTAGDPNLSPAGVVRAKALVHVIPDHFVMPDFIEATAPSKGSSRPLETVQPLADSLHMKILDAYADADYDKLAHDLLTLPQYSGKSILVCWHHQEIPNLAKALGATTCPDKWPSDVFDRVWVLTYDKGQVEFQNLPQKAVPGDSDK